MKKISRFMLLATSTAGLFVLLISTSTLLAQENLFRCKHGIIDGDDGTGKCLLCSQRGSRDKSEDEECREAKDVILNEPASVYGTDSKAVNAMSCVQAKIYARVLGWKSQEDLKHERDSQGAKEITSQFSHALQNSPLRQLESRSRSDQRILLSVDPDDLKRRADDMEEDARKVNDQAYEARRNGNPQTALALDSAAAQTRLLAGTARNLAFRATSEQQSKRNRMQRDPHKARGNPTAEGYLQPTLNDQDILEKVSEETKGAVGQQIGNAAKNVAEEYEGIFRKRPTPRAPGRGLPMIVKDYVETATENVRADGPIATTAGKYIEKEIAPKVDGLLNNPDAEPRLTGNVADTHPSRSVSASQITTLPVSLLPKLPSLPRADVPMTEQEVEQDFQRLRQTSRSHASSPRDLNRLEQTDPVVIETFKKWLEGLAKPAPTPTPLPSKPVDFLGASPSER